VKNWFRAVAFKCNLHRYVAETNANLDAVVDYAAQLQRGTDIKPLWGTAQLFAEPHYMAGLSLFTTLFCSRKHQSMTAGMVRVTNLTPGSEQP
jgi:xylose isomerase